MKKTLLDFVSYKVGSIDVAERYIRAGKVYVNNEEVIIPSIKVRDNDIILVKNIKEWVSRGSYKLLKAIEVFNINFRNKVVLDIGSSTGGFTEVALKNGAKHVYALDVGTNQLDYSLRSNVKVTSLEKTNLKNITNEMFDQKIDLFVTDVSFISLKEVFRVLKSFESIKLIALIKPQFEASNNLILKGGLVEQKNHDKIINKVINDAKEFGFVCHGYEKSPIKGKQSGNIEYISLFTKG